MLIPTAFSFASVLPRGFERSPGLRRSSVFLAFSARQSCASSSLLASALGLCNPFFHPPGLTLRSSGLAYGKPLTFAVSPITRSMRAATCSSARPCSKGFQAFWASSACQPSATSYPSCSGAPLSWPSGFSWAAHIFKAGRSLLAFGSNSAVKRPDSPPLTLVR